MTAQEESQLSVRRVLVIGAGTMGMPLALALAGSGLAVRVSDRNEAALARASAYGLESGIDPIADVSWADVIVMSLPDAGVVASVLESSIVPHLQERKPRQLFIDTTTCGPTQSRVHAAKVNAAGGAYVEAPLLGHPDNVGGWTALLSGDPSDCQRAAFVLEHGVATRVRNVGQTGAASTMKVLNNLMFAAITAVTAEVVVTLEQSGLDPHTFIQAVSKSGAGSVSPLFCEVAPRMAMSVFDEPRFSVDLLSKDAALALDVVTENGVPSPVAEAVYSVCRDTQLAGFGLQDFAAVAAHYRSFLGGISV